VTKPQRRRIGDILVDSGVITPEQLTKALEWQRRTRDRLGRVLVELDMASERQIADALAEQRKVIAAELTGKPAAAVEGKLEKWYQEVVLLEQPFIRDESKRVRDIITDTIARIGENIQVRRFARFKIGE